ncbi:threonine/serine dehydratase [Arthrobacter sp. NPDC056493]|uniref:threonine/serine dehydratase n=1 Tax=Arthrobacter sp. NPDC056493 TaxID=3345839 RepID=UPI0036702F68
MLTYADIEAARNRVENVIRPVAVAQSDPVKRDAERGSNQGTVQLALEFMQFTGTFKARGAQNFILAHRDAGTLPDAGVTIASGGNAGMACAWAAKDQMVPATVFLPANAPRIKVDRLRGYGADVRLVGSEYAEALAACEEFAAATGALMSHAYDHPLIAAGAGTLMEEIHAQIPDLDTVLVAVGGGGLFSGVATVAQHYGIRTIAVEPENCRALNAALGAGHPVDVAVESVAADALGARRASVMALQAAQHELVQSVLVPDEEIIRARQALWSEHRLAVEHGAATALAGLLSPAGYMPAENEKVCVVLCGANTDPSDLT